MKYQKLWPLLKNLIPFFVFSKENVTRLGVLLHHPKSLHLYFCSFIYVLEDLQMIPQPSFRKGYCFFIVYLLGIYLVIYIFFPLMKGREKN